MKYILFVLFLNGSIYTEHFKETTARSPTYNYTQCLARAQSIKFKFDKTTRMLHRLQAPRRSNVWAVECVPYTLPKNVAKPN